MSIKLIREEINRFLSTEDPEVICIIGKWGVGKTYAWNRYLREAQAEKAIALKRYSYVSLFGIDSLEEFKYSIFQNTVQTAAIDLTPNLETLRSNTLAVTESLGRKASFLLERIPLLKNYVGGLAPAWFLTVTKTIVCIDDIERAGAGLPVRDILGLASHLKEAKKCKVVLILNDGALDAQNAEFRKYFEKVIDISLKFAPSAAESVAIAITGASREEQLLRDWCLKLGISNIRLIKRIERSVKQVSPFVKRFDDGVLTNAVHALTLFGWSIFEPNAAPTIEFLKTRGSGADIRYKLHKKTEEIPPKDAAWHALLDAYGFGSIDELDLVLLDGIRDGYFDHALLLKHAEALDRKLKADRRSGSFMEAWEKYHDSFDNNQDEVLDGMYSSFLSNVDTITPLNMSSTVSLFKELGRAEQARELLQFYVEKRGNEKKLFDLDQIDLFGEVRDQDVRAAFSEKFASFKDERSLKDILLSIQDSWNSEDLDLLAKLPVNDYYKIFKETKGKEKRLALNACLQFDRISNATPSMREIATRARSAEKNQQRVSNQRTESETLRGRHWGERRSGDRRPANWLDSHPPPLRRLFRSAHPSEAHQSTFSATLPFPAAAGLRRSEPVAEATATRVFTKGCVPQASKPRAKTVTE